MGYKVLKFSLSGFGTTILQAFGFYWNSWARWKHGSKRSYCLPLPPPIGCNDYSSSRVEVLENENTDFRILALLGSILTLAGSVMVMDKLIGKSKFFNLLKQIPFFLFFTSAILNAMCCLLAMFRINAVTATQKYQGLISSTSFKPTISTSYYLCAASALTCTFLSIYSYRLTYNRETRLNMGSKTIKQHMSRDLMYPNDKHHQKMITFSSMVADMEEAAAEISVRATTKYAMEEDIAENIKKNFESQFGPTWHCVVGENYGSAIHHKSNEYIEIALPKVSVLLFRCENSNRKH